MPRAKLYAKSHALLPAILNKARGDETGEVFWVRCVGGGGGDSGRVLVVRWLWTGVGGVLAAVIRLGCWWCVGSGRALAAVIRVGC